MPLRCEWLNLKKQFGQAGGNSQVLIQKQNFVCSGGEKLLINKEIIICCVL